MQCPHIDYEPFGSLKLPYAVYCLDSLISFSTLCTYQHVNFSHPEFDLRVLKEDTDLAFKWFYTMNWTIHSTPFGCWDQEYLRIFLYKSKNLSDFFAMIVSGVSIVKKIENWENTSFPGELGSY